MDRPIAFYKYTTYQAAKAIITNCTVKLSIPQAFNDPFDILLEEALGADIEDFLPNLMAEFFDVVSSELDYSMLHPGKMRDQIILINTQHRKLSAGALAERRKAFLQQPPEKIWRDFSFLRESNKQIVAAICGMLSTYGIFCSSINKDSLLMWSHYADHHRGVVLELQPDIDNDSALLLSRPVRYSNERPLLHRTPRDLVERSLLMSSKDKGKAILEPLIYTKSKEWEYEGEYRLACPRFIPKGASEGFLSLYPRELSRIYFGCRMPDEQRQELKTLARNLNSDVGFSRAVMARREYSLDWTDDSD